jgi:hypothetical protein
MKSVEGSEGNRAQLDQQVPRIHGMSLFQRMHLEKSASDVIFKGCRRAAFCAGVDIAVASAARQ